ncbi:MAG: type toxin-antitoxin system HicA family toxin [Mucilaginibacter sp.]|nr:type toxin-antitoxin system HicA family toxin [Mucilaginibacter sp.]
MSPKLPRDISGQQLVKLLSKYGYEVTRQKGSHIRVSKPFVNGDHHLTIPNHSPLKLGTFNSILSEASEKLKVSKDELLNNL